MWCLRQLLLLVLVAFTTLVNLAVCVISVPEADPIPIIKPKSLRAAAKEKSLRQWQRVKLWNRRRVERKIEQSMATGRREWEEKLKKADREESKKEEKREKRAEKDREKEKKRMVQQEKKKPSADNAAETPKSTNDSTEKRGRVNRAAAFTKRIVASTIYHLVHPDQVQREEMAKMESELRVDRLASERAQADFVPRERQGREAAGPGGAAAGHAPTPGGDTAAAEESRLGEAEDAGEVNSTDNVGSAPCPEEPVSTASTPQRDKVPSPSSSADAGEAEASTRPAGVPARKFPRMSRKPTPLYNPPEPPAAGPGVAARKNPWARLAVRTPLRTKNDRVSPSYRVSTAESNKSDAAARAQGDPLKGETSHPRAATATAAATAPAPPFSEAAKHEEAVGAAGDRASQPQGKVEVTPSWVDEETESESKVAAVLDAVRGENRATPPEDYPIRSHLDVIVYPSTYRGYGVLERDDDGIQPSLVRWRSYLGLAACAVYWVLFAWVLRRREPPPARGPIRRRGKKRPKKSGNRR